MSFPANLFLFLFIFSFFFGWFLLYYFIPFLLRFMPDKPNSRSSHSLVVPRGGGFVFFLCSVVPSLLGQLISSLPTMSVIPLLATPLALVGLIDDRLNLSALLRFLLQVITAICIFSLSPIRLFISDIFSYKYPFLVCSVLLCILIVAIINFVNFMDGIDGLVSGCMFVSILSLVFISSSNWSLSALLGSLLAFLCWNWSPAKVFMGDIGSTYLGAVYAALVCHASNWSDLLAFLFLSFPLLVDSFSCLLRRLFAGHNIFIAHRLHLFQRLHQAGLSHSFVSSLYILATLVLSSAFIVGGHSLLFFIAFLELILGFWLDQRLSIPFHHACR